MDKRFIKIFFAVVILICHTSCKQLPDPSPLGPVPSESQLAWQEMEYYGFIHFSMNTFTNQEWGYGDKSPNLFNPTQFDAMQWAKVAKEAGMKGLIITAKHHDGFCLWPSKFTEYSVKNSKWKNGKGDVLRELAIACEKYDLKMGVYLSPWDRNHADYGKPEYITYFRNQLKELLTNYGDIFEVWFDGANGGDGYYGGANEVRKVDKKNYYDWGNTMKIIHKLQPKAIIFGDGGPGTRWVGNEHGFSYKTTWSPLLKDSIYGGMPSYSKKYSMGQENGTHWVPAEADVSIRPGWYYHKSEDNQVKSVKHLLDIYYKSVGRNATLLLNLPVDDTGLVHENDIKQLQKLSTQLKLDFENNLTKNSLVEASNTKGESSKYKASNTIDDNKNTYWTTDDTSIKAHLILDFKKPTTFNRFLIQEYIALGQRVKAFSLEIEVDKKWQPIANETTIGYKRILRFPTVTTSRIKIQILDTKAAALISNIEIYNAPLILDSPKITRNKSGEVSLNIPEKGLSVFYTLDNSDPTTRSKKYTTSFRVDKPTTVKAFSLDKSTNRKSEISTTLFDISKKAWEITDNKNKLYSNQMIDDNKNTDWRATKDILENCKINLGENQSINGFTYTPTQRRWKSGIITHYTFLGSLDGNNWNTLSQGEFSNILANPIQQKIMFDKKTDVRYIKLVANKIMNNANTVLIGEIGLITNN